MGRIKLIVGGLFVVIVGVVVAGVAILSQMDFNQYKGEIAKQAKAATGRDLVIAGDLNLDISLSPKVRVDGVSLSNAKWGSSPHMVKVDSFAAEMQLIPLLFGEIHISEIILIKPDILLETDKSGKGNWVMGTPSTAKEKTASSGATTLPAINKIRIEKAKFIFRDGQKGEDTSIVIDEMQASAADIDEPLNLLFKGAFNDHVVELSGQLGTPQALMEGSAVDVDLALSAVGTEAKITGQIKQPLLGKGLNLALSAKSDNIARLAELAGTEVGKVGPFEMAATVSDSKDSYKLAGLSVKIAESDISGDVTVNLANKTPYVKVDLASNRFSLMEVLPQSDEKAEEAPKAEAKKGDKIFPSSPLPVDGLKAVNADVSYKAKDFILGDFALTNVSDVISLKGGKMTGEHGFGMGGGTFSGHINFDGSRLPANLDIDLTGKDLGLGDSLKQNGITDLIDGAKTQTLIKLKAQGKSVAELMASLNGQTLLNVGEGKINSKYVNLIGSDLVTELTNTLNPFAKKQDYTPLACMVVNLNFDNGVADYDRQIAVQTDKMNVTSSGVIHLGKEQLDIGIKPEPRGDAADLGINASGLASMVRVRGPLSAPGIGVDAMGAAKAAMGIGAAIATGGISLLASGLTDKMMADSAPCDTALGKKAPPKETSGETEQKQQEKSSNPIGGLLNMLGKDK
ncbi:AsmA family protein [Terasakiella pusilla]|uniref:AsmA family protein n=1 Tax=Terasakiella pusilla TaxID=64973 RepID=UPI003AA8185A